MSKNYKNSIDRIVMSDELKDKIIANASKKKDKKNYYKYSSFAACFIMLLFSVFITRYINIYNNRTPDVSFSEPNLSETTTFFEKDEDNTEIAIEVTTYYSGEVTTEKTDNRKSVNAKEIYETKTEIKKEDLTESIDEYKVTENNTENTTISESKSKKSKDTAVESITQQITAYGDVAESSDYDAGSVLSSNITSDESIEEKIKVKEPASTRSFSIASKFRSGYSSGGGGGGYAPKNTSGINDLPYDNIIVDPVYVTETQYYEMIEDIKNLVGFDFIPLPYDENAEICAALNGNTVVIRYIYDDDHITFCAEKGVVNCSHNNSVYYKTEKTDGIILKSDGTNYYLAVCAKSPVSYSICSYKGVAKERILELCNKLN